LSICVIVYIETGLVMSLKSNVVLFALLCCGASVHAQERPPVTWELGTEFYQETYREKVDGKAFMGEDADMYGLIGSVQIPFNSRHALVFSGRYAAGKSTYKGSFEGMPYGSLVIEGQDRYMLYLRSTYEMTLPYVTPSIGVGYRRLVDRLDEAGEGGYKRKSEYWYALLGLESTIPLGQSGWKISPKVAYMHLMRGEQHSDDKENRQHSGYGAELSLALNAPVSPSFNVILMPYYRYWNIGQSDWETLKDNTHFMEPKNTTHEIGVRLSAKF
jgi:hypothetical protein